uniref:Immunoglobulin superfamily member 22 n=1 Tax=Salarias fasciatus TaxID=181472 RepID=A0A672I7Y9_SALFA
AGEPGQIPDGPEFISRPQSQEVVEGEKAEFTCSVSKETFEVRWMKGDSELQAGDKYQMVSDGKRRTLVIKNSELKDEGGYVVLIGTTRASADLTVLGKHCPQGLTSNIEFLSSEGSRLTKRSGLFCPAEKLKIITPLKDTETKEGQEVVLNCEVNTEGAKAKWLKNEETVFESSKYVMVQRDNVFSLRIRDAQKPDEATYTVNLTNQRGEQARSTCSLSVKGQSSPHDPHLAESTGDDHLSVCSPAEESLRIVVPLEDIDTQEKKTVSFSCKVNRPNATLKWMKGSEEISFSKRIVYRVDKDKHTLTIKDCTLADEGEYTAVAADNKSTAELIISEAPTDFSMNLKDQTITEFDDAEFTCKLTKEKADVKWYRDGREIREGPRYPEPSGKVHRLQVCEIRPRDQGQYRVIAKDKDAKAKLELAGEDMSVNQRAGPSAQPLYITAIIHTGRQSVPPLATSQYDIAASVISISFMSPNSVVFCSAAAVPQIKTTDQNYVTDAGKPLVMAVPYSAYPQAEADWLYNNMSLPKDNVHTTADRTEYRLKDPKKSDQGRYRIQIKNKHGEGEAFINLDVIDVPGPVKNLQVVDTADGEVSLAWEEPESDGGSKVISYVVERRDVKRKTWTLATDHAESPEYTVTGLHKDSLYLFRVCARNRVGSGPNVETDKPVQAKNKFDVPDAPLNVEVGDVSKFGCTVSWEPPESDGGSPITSYIIELRDRTSVKWSPVQRTKADELSAIINDVIENKEYIFRVKAENKAGVGKPSAATRPVKIMDPIGQSYGLEVIVPQPLTIRVPITGYPTPVAKWTFGDKELSTEEERVSMMTKSTFTELSVAPSVRPDKGIYTLQLENDVTSVSGEIEVNVIGKRPSVGIFLTWEPPKYDGGSGIRGYNVDRCQRGTDKWEPCGDLVPELKCQVTGLIEGQWYSYRVRALNRLGASRPCKATDEIQAVDPKVLVICAEPPEIQLDAKLLAGLTAKAGSKIELPAEVTGKPEPRVKWTKADLVLKADDRVSIDTKPGHSTVTIAKTKRDDSSTYIIEATNSSGRATATVDVNILGKIHIPIQSH